MPVLYGSILYGSILYGSTLYMPRRWTYSSTWPVELLLAASNMREWTTFICYVVLLYHRSERHPSHKQRINQGSDPRHPLFQHVPTLKRLKSMNSFLHAVKPHSCIIYDWSTHLQSRHNTWQYLNPLGTGVEFIIFISCSCGNYSSAPICA